jgi:hypothetical protein
MAEAILAQILSRLSAIEKKLGVAASSSDGDERSPLAADFEATFVNGHAKTLATAAAALGDDGAKMVRPHTGPPILPNLFSSPPPPPPSFPCARPGRPA